MNVMMGMMGEGLDAASGGGRARPGCDDLAVAMGLRGVSTAWTT